MTTRNSASETLDVTIFDSTYTLRGGSDPAAVRGLAEDLDERMRALAASAPGADPLKVAILSALRLGDEARSVRSEISARLEACASRLERLLEDPPPSPASSPSSPSSSRS